MPSYTVATEKKSYQRKFQALCDQFIKKTNGSQFLKTHTEIVQLKDMNEVMSNALGLFEPIDVEVFALKPKQGFPTELGNNTYLGYVCLSKVSNREDIRMIQFYHENKGCEEITLPFLNIVTISASVIMSGITSCDQHSFSSINNVCLCLSPSHLENSTGKSSGPGAFPKTSY